jgi:hypothetical protein
MKHEFQRVAIVNRGEAAMRFIHALRDFNQEYGTSLRAIALFTDPDRHSMFVREADEAVCLGPAQVLDPNTQQMKSSYVDYGRLETRTCDWRVRTRSGWDGVLWPSTPRSPTFAASWASCSSARMAM